MNSDRPHVIPNLLSELASRLKSPVRPFADIDLSVVEDNLERVTSHCTTVDEVPSTVAAMIDNLADRINRIPGDGELQFQRFVPQPVEYNMHREVLCADGVCVRYTVEPEGEDFRVTLEAVVARGQLIEQPETD